MPLSPSKDLTLYVLGRSSAIVEMVTLAGWLRSSRLETHQSSSLRLASPRLAWTFRDRLMSN